MEENEVTSVRVMTIDDVKANPPVIDRKFILINSSLYTNEAYEYLLDLVNETDSIAFIRDLKKIYTHGSFFGGDVWQASLLCYGRFQIINDDDEVFAELDAEGVNDAIRFKGTNNITITPEEYYIHGEKFKTLNIGYNIANSIDNSVVTIDDSTSQFNLEIRDEKIAINKYIPIRVEVSGDTSVIEYDHKPELIHFNLNIFGTAENKSVYVTTTTNEDIYMSDDYTVVDATISNNTNTEYLIIYSDGQTDGSTSFIRQFGFGLVYGTSQITSSNFLNLDRIVTLDSVNCEFTINQGEEEYGWFACPSIFNPIFTDKYSGMTGGWQKTGTIGVYSSQIEYTVWRTENLGLGETKWIVNEK